MSLHGTLETFALPDVLALLAATKKSGELRVVGGTVDGRVWFDAGNVVATDVGAADAVVDAVFDLLRLKSGKFSFDAERLAAAPGEPVALDAVLGEAQARLAEWRTIEEVVPSLAHAVRLLGEVSDPHVMVSADQWRALVAVASAPTVSGVMDRLHVGEFATCRMLRDLVEAGLVAIEEPVAPPVRAAKPAVAAPVEAPVVPAQPAPVPEEAPAVEAPVAEADPTPAHEVVDEPVAPPAPAVADEEPLARPARVEIAPVVEPVAAGPTAKIAAHLTTPGSEALATDPEPAVDPEPAAEPAKPVKAKAAKAPAARPDGPVGLLEKTVDPQVEPAPAQPEPAQPEPVAPAAEAPAAEAPAAPSEGEADGDEPINRGLLLKFLSSVRT